MHTLHADMQQGQRNKVMQKMRDGKADVVVASDLAARGIDVDNIYACRTTTSRKYSPRSTSIASDGSPMGRRQGHRLRQDRTGSELVEQGQQLTNVEVPETEYPDFGRACSEKVRKAREQNDAAINQQRETKSRSKVVVPDKESGSDTSKFPAASSRSRHPRREWADAFEPDVPDPSSLVCRDIRPWNSFASILKFSRPCLDGDPVVLLETAVTTGDFRGNWSWQGRELISDLEPEWNLDGPVNLELATAMSRCVRRAGAVPATVAIMDGQWHVGLESQRLERLAGDETAGKASITSIAAALQSGANAGTTVSGALIAAGLMKRTIGQAPSVLATGGIGVHFGWSRDNPMCRPI